MSTAAIRTYSDGVYSCFPRLELVRGALFGSPSSFEGGPLEPFQGRARDAPPPQHGEGCPTPSVIASASSLGFLPCTTNKLRRNAPDASRPGWDRNGSRSGRRSRAARMFGSRRRGGLGTPRQRSPGCIAGTANGQYPPCTSCPPCPTLPG